MAGRLVLGLASGVAVDRVDRLGLSAVLVARGAALREGIAHLRSHRVLGGVVLLVTAAVAHRPIGEMSAPTAGSVGSGQASGRTDRTTLPLG